METINVYMKLKKTKILAISEVKEIPKPKNFEKMLDVAKKLSSDFKYVRIDLFNLNRSMKCGEITFTMEGGLFPFYPSVGIFKLSNYLKI